MFVTCHLRMIRIQLGIFLIRLSLSSSMILPCSLCPMGGEPYNAETILPDLDKSCKQYSDEFNAFGSNSDDECKIAIEGLKSYQDTCGCPEVVITAGPCTLCPDGGDPFNVDKILKDLDGKTCKEFSDEFHQFGSSSDETCTEANKNLEFFHSECSCEVFSTVPPPSPCTLCPEGGDPANTDYSPTGLNGTTCKEYSDLFNQYGSSTDDACTNANRDLEFFHSECSCPIPSSGPLPTSLCTLCMDGEIPIYTEKKPTSLNGQTCKEYSDSFSQYGSSTDKTCTDANQKLSVHREDCGCPLFFTWSSHCTLCPEGGDPFNADKKPEDLNGKTCKEYSDEFIKYGSSSDKTCTDANKNLEKYHSECSCMVSSERPSGPSCTLCPDGDIPANLDLKPEALNGKTCKQYSDEFSEYGITTDLLCQAEVTKARFIHAECGCPKSVQEPETKAQSSTVPLSYSSGLLLCTIGFVLTTIV